MGRFRVGTDTKSTFLNIGDRIKRRLNAELARLPKHASEGGQAKCAENTMKNWLPKRGFIPIPGTEIIKKYPLELKEMGETLLTAFEKTE